MTRFNEGDLVQTKLTGWAGVVAATSNMVAVHLDNGEAAVFNEDDIELQKPKPRSFEVGQHVRVDGEIGIIAADDGDDEDELPYTVRFPDNLTEVCDAADLEPWTPELYERVVTDDEPDSPGKVISVDGDTYTIKWDDFPQPQDNWRVKDLVPFAGKPTFRKGDRVVYVRGPLTKGAIAEVVKDQVNGSLAVVWDDDHWQYAGQLNGIYSADSFDHFHASVYSEAA